MVLDHIYWLAGVLLEMCNRREQKKEGLVVLDHIYWFAGVLLEM